MKNELKTPTNYTVSEIFSNVHYVIPSFQRPYVWDADNQCKQLFDDLLALSDKVKKNPKETHYLGTLIVCPADERGYKDYGALLSGREDISEGACTLYAETIKHLEKQFLTGRDGKVHIEFVIDGQQRMTTLLILLIALLRIEQEHSRFEGDGTSANVIELRQTIEHMVGEKPKGVKLPRRGSPEIKTASALKLRSSLLEDEGNLLALCELYNLVLTSERFDAFENLLEVQFKGRKLYVDNFKYFSERIIRELKNKKAIEAFWKNVLYRVKMLKLTCGGIDDALELFSVANSGGIPLSRIDLCKPKMVSLFTAKERGEFLRQWKEWGNSKIEDQIQKTGTLEFMFNVLSRVYAVEHGKYSQKGSQEKYNDLFSKNGLKKSVFDDLKKLYASLGWQGEVSNDDKVSDDKDRNEVYVLLRIIEESGYQTVKYPLIAFLLKKGDFAEAESGERSFTLTEGALSEFKLLCSRIVNYLYAGTLIGKNKNDVDAKSEQLFPLIVKNENYAQLLSLDVNEFKSVGDRVAEFRDFSATEDDKRLQDRWIYVDGGKQRKLKRGLLLLSTYLECRSGSSSMSGLVKFLQKTGHKWEIEHVVPQDETDIGNSDWASGDHRILKNMLGNLILLEKACNIKASNWNLGKKVGEIGIPGKNGKEKHCDSYTASLSPEAKVLIDEYKKGETSMSAERVKKRTSEKVKRLKDFLCVYP